MMLQEDKMDTRPPRSLSIAMTLTRVHMVITLILLGVAILFETDATTSTNNYYHQLLAIPRTAFPLVCIGAGIVSIGAMLLLRKDNFMQSLVFAVMSIPFLVYVLTSTYYVYFVLPGRTLVTFTMYWAGGILYYLMLVTHVAIGAWQRELSLNGRRGHDA